MLVEAGNRLLAAFPESLSQSAKAQLEKLGVEVRLGAAVTKCDDDGVTLADGQHDRLGLRALGGRRHGVARRQMAGRRRPIAPAASSSKTTSASPAIRNIFVIGDTASVKARDGRPVPGVAPAAKQMGRYAARLIKGRLGGRPVGAFRYADFGNLATIGRKAAVADFGRIRLTGFPAWLLWSFAHLWFLVGFRNRVVVFLDWAWAYATFDRGARLITERRAS